MQTFVAVISVNFECLDIKFPLDFLLNYQLRSVQGYMYISLQIFVNSHNEFFYRIF